MWMLQTLGSHKTMFDVSHWYTTTLFTRTDIQMYTYTVMLFILKHKNKPIFSIIYGFEFEKEFL